MTRILSISIIVVTFFISNLSCAQTYCDTTFYPDSDDVECLKVFKDSSLVSIKCYYKSGQLKSSEEYDNKMLTSLRKTWFESGAEKSSVAYSEGIPNERGLHWNEAGEVEIIVEGDGVRHTESELYSSGKVKTKHYYDQAITYRIEQFCENGQLRTIDYINRETYPKVVWFCNQTIQIEGTCNQYQKYVGEYIEYFENGKIRTKGQYKKQQGFDEIKIGYWVHMDESGLIVYEEKYSDTGRILYIRVNPDKEWKDVSVNSEN